MSILTPAPRPPSLDPTSLAGLRDRVRGAVHLPGEPGYDAARAGFNLTHSHHPDVVVSVADAGDVVAAVRFAVVNGRTVAVQATGHGVVRTADGAVLVDTRAMDGFHVDPVARRARVEAGTTWGPVLAAAQAHGLAPLLGSSPTVGVVGYTLGGGMGWLARPHGLASDRVVRLDLVTATGELVTASATEHADLFWALRGAGHGALGIVTAIEFDLVPVSTVVAGNLYYPAELAGEVLRRWRDWLPSVPQALTSAVTLMNYPPFDHVPPPVRGRSFAIVRGCFDGDPAVAERLLDHWRSWRQPEIDAFGPMPFAAAATISNDPVDPVPATATAVWLHDLDDRAIDALVAGVLPHGAPPALVFGEVRHAGGAIAEADPATAAYGNREAPLSLELLGVTPTPAAHAAVTAHTDAVRAALEHCCTGGTYLNFTEGEERRAGVVAGVGVANAARLAAIKAVWDPDGVLDHGLDLRATGASPG